MSYHRRPLPEPHVDFSSPEGRQLLREALADGTAEAFFPLIAHLHTQAEPAWCGLGTLVTVLNALQIDPGRTWKGPWRWFGEELLDCCKKLDAVGAEGLSLHEVACLARCNGASVREVHGDEGAFRADLLTTVRSPAGPFFVANYDRQALGQTGAGHFSPVAAWHAASDRALVLDVARFKYPPHWVDAATLWAATQVQDPATGAARGWLVMERGDRADYEGVQALLDRLGALGLETPCCPEPA
jgi:glutathione gamma-glutamylcysteinyltransferase